MKINQNKNRKKVWKLTAIFFIPVAILVSLFFLISNYVFQGSIYQIDSRVIELDSLSPAGLLPEEEFDATFEIAQVKEELVESNFLRSVSDGLELLDTESFEVQDLDVQAEVFVNEATPEDGSDYIESNFSELDYPYENSLNKIEQDAYGDAFKTLVPFFVLTLLVVLIFSYLAARLMIGPMVRSANKQKRFIADASHEIKTPLSLMKTEIELFNKLNKDKLPEQKDISNLTKNLLEDIDRLSNLSNKLLSLARIDSKKEISYQECDFNEIDSMLFDLVESFSKKYPEKNIKYLSNIDDSFNLIASCYDIKQIIEILIENSCLYMGDNKEILLDVSKKNSNLVVSVKDNGRGIDQKDLKKIFDRFYRSDKNMHLPGTGLGLSIAKELTEKNNGKINVSSGDSGTEFMITFLIK